MMDSPTVRQREITKPSMVFLGETLSKSLCFPNRRPAQYASVSPSHIMMKMASTTPDCPYPRSQPTIKKGTATQSIGRSERDTLPIGLGRPLNNSNESNKPPKRSSMTHPATSTNGIKESGRTATTGGIVKSVTDSSNAIGRLPSIPA